MTTALQGKVYVEKVCKKTFAPSGLNQIVKSCRNYRRRALIVKESNMKQCKGVNYNLNNLL